MVISGVISQNENVGRAATSGAGHQEKGPQDSYEGLSSQDLQVCGPYLVELCPQPAPTNG